ncbi:MAG: hypothetical protein LC107_11800 [Chitinophagales bacterium]|nr:hypothetical protein [Chitinophagales bacterium]
MEKFKNVGSEPDTKIISRNPIKLQNYDALHEVWFWDGIKGESIIFVADEVKDLSKEEIIDLISVDSQIEVKSKTQMTLSKNNPEFMFVNFNFEY